MYHIQDINLFAVGTTVSIHKVPEFEDIRIERISDSGVTVSGPKCPANCVISGRSPAYLPETKVVITPSESNNDRLPFLKPERVARGTYTEKMKHIKVPSDKNFTIKQVAELNDIPTNYALTWVKDNCVESGKADKVEGQRGKTATLYSLK